MQALLFLAIIASFYSAREFLLPELFIALTLRPAVRFLEEWHVPPWRAAAVFVFVILIFAALVEYLLSVPISGWIDQVPVLQQKFASKFVGLGEVLKKFSNLSDQIQNGSTAAQDSPLQEVIVRQHSFPGLLMSLTGYPIQLAVTFHLLGMPSPHLWGLSIFIFNFVPDVSTLAGVTLVGFMAVVSFDSLA